MKFDHNWSTTKGHTMYGQPIYANATQSPADAAPSVRPIAEAIESQVKGLAELHQALTELENRLNPVLAPPHPAEVAKGQPEPRPGLASAIQSNNRDVNAAIYRVGDLIGRLEL